jgi:hypothetical protein
VDIDQLETELAEKLEMLAAAGTGCTDDRRLLDFLDGFLLQTLDTWTADGSPVATFSAIDRRTVEIRAWLYVLGAGKVPVCARFHLAETLPQIECYEVKAGDADETRRPSVSTVSWPFAGEIRNWQVTYKGTGYRHSE